MINRQGRGHLAATMFKLRHLSVLAATLCACAQPDSVEPGPDPDRTVPMPPGAGIRPIHSVPGGSAVAQMMFGENASYMTSGPVAPGSAHFDAATYSTTGEPLGAGTGGFSISIDGTLYTATTDTMAFQVYDDPGTPYLALVGFDDASSGTTSFAHQVVVVVPESDFAIGATVALDGNERMALYANGDPMKDEPDVVGAATTGTVTFTSGTLVDGAMITASVAGDFGAIDIVPGTPPGGGTISDGTYTLNVSGPGEVFCDGAMAGSEAAFAGITLGDLGFTSGSVTIASAGGLEISCSPISAAFASSPLKLDSDGDVVFGVVDLSGPGPASTTLAGKFLALETSSASPTFVNGGVGAGYVNAAGDGGCSVSFGATLTNP